MTPDPPQYQAPAPDPALALLTQQNQQQQVAAIQDRTSASSAALMQRYGTRIAMQGGVNGNAPVYASPLLRGAFTSEASPFAMSTSSDGRL